MKNAKPFWFISMENVINWELNSVSMNVRHM